MQLSQADVESFDPGQRETGSDLLSYSYEWIFTERIRQCTNFFKKPSQTT